MRIRIYDIEAYQTMFYVLFYNPETDEWQSFEISKWKNELYSLVKFLTDRDYDYLVGFNCVNYDGQLLEYILVNAENWYDLNGEQINKKIKRFSNDTIHDTNYGLFPKYSEDDFTVPHIDLFKIMHYDNENKRTSLKWLEYMMDWETLEELPYAHDDETLNRRQLLEVQHYCKNDVGATYRFYQYVTGNVEHAQYKGKNKVQDRLDLINSGILPKRAMNYSDSKIGDELNKVAYCKLANCTTKDLYTLKKGRGATKKFTYGDAIPSYVEFKTPELQEFKRKISKERVSLLDTDTQEFPLKFRGTEYTVARGGIHSTEKNRIIIPNDDEKLEDADIGSQYPNSIVKRKLFPSHLGELWLIGYNDTIVSRLDDKAKAYDDKYSAEERRIFLGMSESKKLQLNAGGFGQTNLKTNWQYDPRVTYFCTIGNQFEILLLIEMLELNGIHCVSANTDGITCLYKRDLEAVYYSTCKEWEKIVGNDKQGMLEYAEYTALYQESINHYIAVTSKGKIKIKGRFTTEDEIHKNNSDKISRIERKALVAYFTKGIPIEQTIRNSENIWDFVIGKKSSRDYRWETINYKTNQITQYKKLIRFYVSKDGEKLIKRKNEDSAATGSEVTQFFQGKGVTIFNFYKAKPIHDYNIDYQFYIDNIMEIINKIESGRKKKGKPILVNPNQTSLF